MGLRGSVFAAVYDRQMRRAEAAVLGELRREVLAAAAGDVLEVGGGTGANLAAYPATIGSLTITEPAPAMVRRLRAKVGTAAVTIVAASAEHLPFADGTFDTVVSTLVLCGVADQPRALGEIRRVLRPGGRLLFIEHVRAEEPDLARHQDRINWLNRLLVSCDCNRATVTGMTQAGFTIDTLTRLTLPVGPRYLRPFVAGVAGRG